jgi:Flp pilus assembly protein TadD
MAVDAGQFDRAEEWLSRAQKLAPGDPRTNFALAACLRAAGRGDEAKAYHDRYLRIEDERRKQFEQVAPPAPGGPK